MQAIKQASKKSHAVKRERDKSRRVAYTSYRLAVDWYSQHATDNLHLSFFFLRSRTSSSQSQLSGKRRWTYLGVEALVPGPTPLAVFAGGAVPILSVHMVEGQQETTSTELVADQARMASTRLRSWPKRERLGITVQYSTVSVAPFCFSFLVAARWHCNSPA